MDLRRLPQTLAYTLDQADAFDLVQLRQQPDRFAVAAAHGLLDLLHGVVDIYAPLVIIPAVAGGQVHPVQQQAVEHFGADGQPLELLAGKQDAGNAVVAECLLLAAIEIVKSDLVAHCRPPLHFDLWI